jgi:PKD repeat protein
LNDSSDADGDALRFRWDFGDGSLSTEVNPTHTFTVAGQFAVVLVATDSHGLASEPNLERITVRGSATTTTASTSTTTSRPPTTTTVTPTSTTSTTVLGPNAAPRADFRADPASGAAPLVVRFSNASSDRDGDALSFLWDFGDGTQSREENPVHTFGEAGEFTVVLVATDARGLASAPKQERITVRRATTTSSSTTTSATAPPTTSTTLRRR